MATFTVTAATCKTPADPQRRPWQVQVQQCQRQSYVDICGSCKGSDKLQVSTAALSSLATPRMTRAVWYNQEHLFSEVPQEQPYLSDCAMIAQALAAHLWR